MSNNYASISTGALWSLYENAMKALANADARVMSANEIVVSAEAIREATFAECEKWSAILDERERQAA